jgi:hypothetical protein
MGGEVPLGLPTTAPREFYTTPWSVVLAVGQSADAQASEDQEQLCRACGYSLSAFVLRRGQRLEESQDPIQQLCSLFPSKNNFRLTDCARL